MLPAIAGRGRQRCSIAALLLALALPSFGAVSDPTATGVAVFGSYLNALNAEREAEILGERLGMALAVREIVVADGTVFHRVVSATMAEREVRELISRAAARGQDAWFAASIAPVPTGLESPEPVPPKADPATLVEVAPVVAEDAAIVAVESQGRQQTAFDVADASRPSHFARVDLTGSLSAESRMFYRDAGHVGQGSHPNSLVGKLGLYLEHRAGWSFTLSPFYRYDSDDPSRTHADVHEAYGMFVGDVGDAQWELRVGADRVFWGVVESNNLVDIVNQVDLVEHPDEKSKLGQFMGHLTYAAPWGVVELLGMPYHRQRTFPGRAGRLRFPWLVDPDLATYESGAEDRHVDLAARYSHTIRALDFGISAFDGTSREPFLALAVRPDGEVVLAPHYAEISQLGLDSQLTLGAWLLKLEGIHRTGMLNRLGREEAYSSFVLGGEYSFYSAFGTALDVTVLTEWCYDERGVRSTTKFENDILLGARLAFNDVQGTELLVSTLQGADHDSRVFSVELNRRLSDRWALEVEAIALRELDPTDILYETRRDSFLEVGLVYSF